MNLTRNISPAFAARWLILCGLGLGAGLAVGLGLAEPIEAVVGMMLVTPIVLGIAGSVLGASQWLAIWRSPRVGVRWIIASALGLGLGMTLGVVLVEMVGRAITGEQVRLVSVGPLGRVAGLALVGAVSGLGTGAAQWLAMRRHAGMTWRWAPWCAAAFALGLAAGAVAVDLLPGGPQGLAAIALLFGVAGLTIATLTIPGAARIALGSDGV